jgi:hypothetical protein
MRKFVAIFHLPAIFVVLLISNLGDLRSDLAQEAMPNIDIVAKRGAPELDGHSAVPWYGVIPSHGSRSFRVSVYDPAAATTNQSKPRGGPGTTYVDDPINYATGNAYLNRHFHDDPNSRHEFGNNWRISFRRSISLFRVCPSGVYLCIPNIRRDNFASSALAMQSPSYPWESPRDAGGGSFA